MTTYTGNCSNYLETNAVGLFESLSQRFSNWVKVQALKLEISKERRLLLEINEAGLRDMGITRAQAVQEARRTDLPNCRLKMHGIEVC